MRFCLFLWAPIMMALCSSCGGDSEQAELNKKLEAEIEVLEKELAQTNGLLKTEAKDVGEDIKQVAAEIAHLKNEASRMEAELVDLRDEKESLELRFTNYRSKHPIN